MTAMQRAVTVVSAIFVSVHAITENGMVVAYPDGNLTSAEYDPTPSLMHSEPSGPDVPEAVPLPVMETEAPPMGIVPEPVQVLNWKQTVPRLFAG
jgi:hypothetical protein